MGFKRPLDDEKFHELPLKHSRQLGYTDKSNQFEEFSPRNAVFQKPVATVNEGNLYKSQGGESSDGEMFDVESNLVYPGHDMDGTFTWITNDYGGRDATHSPHSVKYFELGMPPRVFAPVQTFYSFLLDQPARKQVPIGPGHQAQIPEWEGHQNGNLDPSGMTVQNHVVECDDIENLYGTCVVPMPALNTLSQTDDIVGKGRKHCVCGDRGSIRCVRQHIIEAREVVKMFGYETFKNLGFCDMGEEVAHNWSEENEQLFHEVVYSNPVTLGRNFWKHLEVAFCSRSNKEIVSYYFNVFVLRRRATQNRTLLLDIDSDDDEWHGCYGSSSGNHYVEEDEEDEEDSAIESPLHQVAEKVYPLHQEEGEVDASNNSNDNTYIGTREGGSGLCDQHKIYSTVEYMDRFSGRNGERLNVEDDSCTSFEPAHDAVNCAKKGGLGEHHKKLKDCNGPMDTKVWDASRCLNVSPNGKDHQPSCSIMEEIFGHGSWENKARNK